MGGATAVAAAAKTAIDIQTATHAKKNFKTIFLKTGGHKIFGNESFHRFDRFCQIFVQIGVILAIFRPFEKFRAVRISRPAKIKNSGRVGRFYGRLFRIRFYVSFELDLTLISNSI